jgi:hypothetical protein
LTTCNFLRFKIRHSIALAPSEFLDFGTRHRYPIRLK